MTGLVRLIWALHSSSKTMLIFGTTSTFRFLQKKEDIYTYIRLMLLKSNKILKIVAILLFSLELLAPAVFATSHPSSESKSENTNFESLPHSFDTFSNLIFEEVSEEREGKNHALTGICFIEIFSTLHKFKSSNFTRLIPHQRFDTQPPLFTLNRVLLI